MTSLITCYISVVPSPSQDYALSMIFNSEDRGDVKFSPYEIHS